MEKTFRYEMKRLSERKQRLVTCAFARWYLKEHPDQKPERASQIENAEFYSDGLDDLACYEDWFTYPGEDHFPYRGKDIFNMCVYREPCLNTLEQWIDSTKGVTQCLILNILDEFVTPADIGDFTPELFNWNDQTIPRIAEKIYTERDFVSLPVLADALQDAGCEDECVLNHCRQTFQMRKVRAGYNCPSCDSLGRWRSGVGFEHEKICMSKLHERSVSWEPGEVVEVETPYVHSLGCFTLDWILKKG